MRTILKDLLFAVLLAVGGVIVAGFFTVLANLLFSANATLAFAIVGVGIVGAIFFFIRTNKRE